MRGGTGVRTRIAQPRSHFVKHLRQGLLLYLRSGINNSESRQPHKLSPQSFKGGANLILVRRHYLGSRGGCWRAEISHKICNGEIRFMADSGDNGNNGFADRAGYLFLIEGPQILTGSAAATNNQYVDQITTSSFAQSP